jgi:hypothetical protein
MTLTQLKKLIRETKPALRKKLYEWLSELIREDQESAMRVTSESQPEKIEKADDGRTYRLESVRCGKKGCKCADGKLHGPYWYAYWLENGKTKSQYVGKKLPRIE